VAFGDITEPNWHLVLWSDRIEIPNQIELALGAQQRVAQGSRRSGERSRDLAGGTE
jgi:hypothetical protein